MKCIGEQQCWQAKLCHSWWRKYRTMMHCWKQQKHFYTCGLQKSWSLDWNCDQWQSIDRNCDIHPSTQIVISHEGAGDGGSYTPQKITMSYPQRGLGAFSLVEQYRPKLISYPVFVDGSYRFSSRVGEIKIMHFTSPVVEASEASPANTRQASLAEASGVSPAEQGAKPWKLPQKIGITWSDWIKTKNGLRLEIMSNYPAAEAEWSRVV